MMTRKDGCMVCGFQEIDIGCGCLYAPVLCCTSRAKRKIAHRKNRRS
jgi:hypothetical protein